MIAVWTFVVSLLPLLTSIFVCALEDGLVNYWPFDGTPANSCTDMVTSDILRLAPNPIHTPANVCLIRQCENRFGEAASAVALRNGGFQAQHMFADDYTGGAFTVSAWVRIVEVRRFARVLEMSHVSGYPSHYGQLKVCSKSLVCFLSDANKRSRLGFKVLGQAEVWSNVPLPVNEWTHVAYTLDGRVGRIFMNGKQVATGDVSIHYFASSHHGRAVNYIGASFDAIEAEFSFNSDMLPYYDLDELKIYNRALKQEEIRAQVSSDSRLIHHWPLKDGNLDDRIGSSHLTTATSDTDHFGVAFSVEGPYDKDNTAMALRNIGLRLPPGDYFQPGSDFTISLWLKLVRRPTLFQRLFMFRNSDNQTNHTSINVVEFILNSPKMGGYPCLTIGREDQHNSSAIGVNHVKAGVVFGARTSKNGVSLKQWFHLAVVLRAKTRQVSICVNGEDITDASTSILSADNGFFNQDMKHTPEITSTNGIGIAYDETDSEGFMDIADLKLFKRALSTLELSQIAKNTS